MQLPDQPFRVLQALLEHPGELVSREDLISRLWADGTHVDYERGLNAAVARLRQILADSIDDPKYIETIPKRGYRFIGYDKAPNPGDDVVAEEVKSPPPPAPAEPHPTEAPARLRRFVVWAVTAAAAALVIGGSTRMGRDVSGVRNEPQIALPLTSDVGYERNGSLSPDGRQVAYDWTREPGDTRIFVRLVKGGDPVRLTSAERPEYNPVWSPDGTKVAFLRAEEPVRLAVYVSPGPGGLERKLTEFRMCAPIDVSASIYSGLLSWAPDGKYLVTTGCEDQGNSGLLLVAADTGEARWLLAPPKQSNAGAMQASFSPDGGMLAFALRVSTVTSDLYVASFTRRRLTLGQPRRITWLERSVAGITWLPDGRSLVFSAGSSVIQHLFQVGVQPGSTPVPLHWAGSEAIQPSISPSAALLYTHRTTDRNIWRQEIPSAGERIASACATDRLHGG